MEKFASPTGMEEFASPTAEHSVSGVVPANWAEVTHIAVSICIRHALQLGAAPVLRMYLHNGDNFLDEGAVGRSCVCVWIDITMCFCTERYLTAFPRLVEDVPPAAVPVPAGAAAEEFPVQLAEDPPGPALEVPAVVAVGVPLALGGAGGPAAPAISVVHPGFAAKASLIRFGGDARGRYSPLKSVFQKPTEDYELRLREYEDVGFVDFPVLLAPCLPPAPGTHVLLSRFLAEKVAEQVSPQKEFVVVWVTGYRYAESGGAEGRCVCRYGPLMHIATLSS
jgi:hypothetical protein